MTLQTPMRCSALADQLLEPMPGTVDLRTRWLLLEGRSAWGTDAVADVFGRALVARAKELMLRVLLVGRHEGDPAADTDRRAMLVDVLRGETAIRTVSGPADVSIEAAAMERPADFGRLSSEPFFLVCTNGKRDACCALRGRAVMGAMAAEHGDRLWECTHLGGHRFAGNLVCLPHGIVYGRVGPADAPRLADAYLDGRLDPALLRGRSAWLPSAQVAEVALRKKLGLDRLDDLRLEEAEEGTDEATVELVTADGRSYRFELVAERESPPRPTSCRGDELEEPVHWVIAS